MSKYRIIQKDSTIAGLTPGDCAIIPSCLAFDDRNILICAKTCHSPNLLIKNKSLMKNHAFIIKDINHKLLIYNFERGFWKCGSRDRFGFIPHGIIAIAELIDKNIFNVICEVCGVNQLGDF